MTSENNQLVVFRVGGEFYGVPISMVHEIIRTVQTSKIPQMPQFMKGVTNLRGKIIAIYDLSELFGMGKRLYADEAKIIVTNKEKAGFIVDEVKEIIHIVDEDFESFECADAGAGSNLVEGFYKTNDNVITILNLENFKESKEYEKNTKN